MPYSGRKPQQKQFIIIGTHFWKSAHLHTIARDKRDALKEYHNTFGQLVKEWLPPSVTDIEEEPYMARFWDESRTSYSDEISYNMSGKDYSYDINEL